MNEITIKAKGKINLLLDVTGKRDNGYHDITTIMQSVNLYDMVTIRKTEDKALILKTDFDALVAPQDNIAYKAMQLMQDKYDTDCGFSAEIQKNIPIAGGMGGGSTDAAAVINAINILCDLKLEKEELLETGLTLGADVPFCIMGGCALAYGVGEILTPIAGLKDCRIAIVNPQKHISTKEVYQAVSRECTFGQIDENRALKALKEKNVKEYEDVFLNIMQSVTTKMCPEIEKIVDKLKSMGAASAMMSGSGPTCFGIFVDDIDKKVLQHVFDGYFTAVTEAV